MPPSHLPGATASSPHAPELVDAWCTTCSTGPRRRCDQVRGVPPCRCSPSWPPSRARDLCSRASLTLPDPPRQSSSSRQPPTTATLQPPLPPCYLQPPLPGEPPHLPCPTRAQVRRRLAAIELRRVRLPPLHSPESLLCVTPPSPSVGAPLPCCRPWIHASLHLSSNAAASSASGHAQPRIDFPGIFFREHNNCKPCCLRLQPVRFVMLDTDARKFWTRQVPFQNV